MSCRNVEELRKSNLPPETVIKVPIRRIPIVIDTKDPLAPELGLDDFRKLFGQDPQPDRYRVISIEVITSPDDQQPMLVSECARYSRFLRREADNIYFRRELEAL
jgi:hypothetical protein